MNAPLNEYLSYGRQLFGGFRVRTERDIARQRQLDTAPYLDQAHPLTILDLANGRLRPQYLLLKAAGHSVYGVDLLNRPTRDRGDYAYAVARRIFAWKLGVRPERRSEQTLACASANQLAFHADSFDLVTSVAAFEHFLNVPQVVAELARVVRPGGLVWAAIHPFTALSGGHNVTLNEIPLRSMPPGADAWDHLRQRKLPFRAPLNEWRIAQYLDTFGRHFEIVKHYCASREGEHLLTTEIAAELSAYSRDELTCLGYIILAHKPAQEEHPHA